MLFRSPDDDQVLAAFLSTRLLGRSATWLPFNSINVAYHALTQARGAALVDLLISNPPPRLEPPAILRGNQWLEIGIHDIQLSALGLSSQSEPHQVRNGVLIRLLEAVPALDALRVLPQHATEWKYFISKMKVRCNPRQSRSATVYAVMPPATLPSLGPLFSREVTLTQISYEIGRAHV